MAHLKTKSFPTEEKILLETSENEDLFSEENDDENSMEDEHSSDSDSAPDIVSFKAGEENMLSFKKNRTKLIKLKKEELKKKRKELHKRNLRQKEEKKKNINMKKLPDELLENLDEFSPNINASEAQIPKNALNAEDKPKEISNVIAVHGSTVFRVKVLPKEVKKPNFISEDIANFKNKMFYGNRIKREPSTRHYLMRKEKNDIHNKRSFSTK